MFQYKPEYVDSMRPARHILHIGASYGQETQSYLDAFGSQLESITYIEPIPEVFKKLDTYMDSFRSKISIRCIQALLSNDDNQEVDFYISSNDGISSSMYPKNESEWVWDHVNFSTTLKLKTITLNTLLLQYPHIKDVDTVVIDVQGAELLVLHGMSDILPTIQQIVCEFSTKEFYKGSALVSNLEAFLQKNAFKTRRIGDTHGDLLCFKDLI